MNDFLKDLIETLSKDEGKDFAGQFTFANVLDYEWVHDAYENKFEAIKAGKEMFPNGFVVGQLKDNGLNYDVVNHEKFFLS